MGRVDLILSCFTHAVPGDFTVVSACGRMAAGCCVVMSVEVAEYVWLGAGVAGGAMREPSRACECGRNTNEVWKVGRALVAVSAPLWQAGAVT